LVPGTFISLFWKSHERVYLFNLGKRTLNKITKKRVGRKMKTK
jgi:hypothetical protein